MKEPSRRRAGLAVVTGASSGIGAALAPRLAADGYDLLLVARREERLRELAERVREAHGVQARCLALDVTEEDALERLLEAAPEPAVLVNNAGAGRFGPAVEASPAEQARIVRLNCESLTRLTLGYLPGMVSRGRGVVVQMASIAGFQPVPYFAVYAATKAYVLSFSEALDKELEGSGVRVVSVCPGPVPTEFQAAAGSGDAAKEPAYNRRTPEQIAEATARAIARPRPVVTAAPYHGFLRFAQRFLPRRTVLSVAARKMRQRGI